MPPRYAYWTIIIDNLPTAFRARDREELLPTFRQLSNRNPTATIKWFSKGRLWESPEEARRASEQPREPRGKDWRPGGRHEDPRAKYQKGRREQAGAGGKRREEARPDSRQGQRDGTPAGTGVGRPDGRRPNERHGQRDWHPKAGQGGSRRERRGPDERQGQRDWQAKAKSGRPPGGRQGQREWSEKPGAGGGRREQRSPRERQGQWDGRQKPEAGAGRREEGRPERRRPAFDRSATKWPSGRQQREGGVRGADNRAERRTNNTPTQPEPPPPAPPRPPDPDRPPKPGQEPGPQVPDTEKITILPDPPERAKPKK